MITPYLSNIKIIKEILSDYEKVNYKLEYLKDKAIKKFKKEGKRENYYYEEYIHQTTRNKYVVGWMVDHNNFDNPDSITFCTVSLEKENAVLVVSKCPSKPKGFDHMIEVPALSTYSKHFWLRYRERELNNSDIPFYQMVAKFLIRNRRSIFSIQLNQDILKLYEKYGEYSGNAMVVNEGLCPIESAAEGDMSTLCTKDNNVCIFTKYKTILTYKMLHPNQQTALKKAINEHIKKANKDIADNNKYVDEHLGYTLA